MTGQSQRTTTITPFFDNLYSLLITKDEITMNKKVNENWIKKFGFYSSVNEKVNKADFGLIKLMNNLIDLKGVNDDYKQNCEDLLLMCSFIQKDLNNLMLSNEDFQLNGKIQFEKDLKEYKSRKAMN